MEETCSAAMYSTRSKNAVLCSSVCKGFRNFSLAMLVTTLPPMTSERQAGVPTRKPRYRDPLTTTPSPTLKATQEKGIL